MKYLYCVVNVFVFLLMGKHSALFQSIKETKNNKITLKSFAIIAIIIYNILKNDKL